MMTIEDAIYEDAQITGFFKGKKEGKREGKLEGKIQGIKEAKKEVKENEIYRLITRLGFSDQQIADYAEVSFYFVKKIRTKLKSENLIH